MSKGEALRDFMKKRLISAAEEIFAQFESPCQIRPLSKSDNDDSLFVDSSKLKLNTSINTSQGEALKDFMKERMTAAAEEIFAQFERTIAQFEEELRSCREKKKQRKQALPETVISPRATCLRADESPGPGLIQPKDEPEEHSVTCMEVCVPEFIAVCVKSEEQSLLLQTEYKEEPQEEDVSAEPHLHSETERDTEHSSDTDQDEDWTAPVSCSDDEDHHNQVQISAQNSDLFSIYKYAPEACAILNNANRSGTAEGKILQCPICKKILKGCQRNLLIHMTIHTGERPYSCSICNKTFNNPSNLAFHKKIHSGERPYRCLTCDKTFAQKSYLEKHKSVHTGERAFRCSICNKSYRRLSNLSTHLKRHTGERSHVCSTCNKGFYDFKGLKRHKRIHTGEKPYSCPTCNRTFNTKSSLIRHTRTQTPCKVPYVVYGPGLNQDFTG